MTLRLFLSSILLLAAATGILSGQSSDQNFPTPITANELRGEIRARAVGDARLTTHFFVFEGGQGDIFINVVAKNFTGDIDIFAADDMRLLGKMAIFADVGVTENGRLIYLRRPERLLLRVEGRTPGDDPATYQIKFAGSFIAMNPVREQAPPTIAGDRDTDIRTEISRSTGPQKVPVTTSKKPKNIAVVKGPAAAPDRKRVTRPVVVVKDYSIANERDFEKPKTVVKSAAPRKVPGAKRPDPMANVRLVITLKAGTVITRVMTDIRRFGYDKGILTIVDKDGRINIYAVTDIANVTMQ